MASTKLKYLEFMHLQANTNISSFILSCVFLLLIVISVGNVKASNIGGVVINGCMQQKTGNTRIISTPEECRLNENSISWIGALPGQPIVVDSEGEKLPGDIIGSGNAGFSLGYEIGDQVFSLTVSRQKISGWRLNYADSTCSGTPLMNTSEGIVQAAAIGFDRVMRIPDPDATPFIFTPVYISTYTSECFELQTRFQTEVVSTIPVLDLSQFKPPFRASIFQESIKISP